MKRLLLIPVLLCAFTAKGYAYDERPTYSADQLFDNSLQELREAMAKAKQSNEEFKGQNRFLKEQINELEEAVSAAGSDKIIVEAIKIPDGNSSTSFYFYFICYSIVVVNLRSEEPGIAATFTFLKYQGRFRVV